MADSTSSAATPATNAMSFNYYQQAYPNTLHSAYNAPYTPNDLSSVTQQLQYPKQPSYYDDHTPQSTNQQPFMYYQYPNQPYNPYAYYQPHNSTTSSAPDNQPHKVVVLLPSCIDADKVYMSQILNATSVALGHPVALENLLITISSTPIFDHAVHTNEPHASDLGSFHLVSTEVEPSTDTHDNVAPADHHSLDANVVPRNAADVAQPVPFVPPVEPSVSVSDLSTLDTSHIARLRNTPAFSKTANRRTRAYHDQQSRHSSTALVIEASVASKASATNKQGKPGSNKVTPAKPTSNVATRQSADIQRPQKQGAIPNHPTHASSHIAAKQSEMTYCAIMYNLNPKVHRNELYALAENYSRNLRNIHITSRRFNKPGVAAVFFFSEELDAIEFEAFLQTRIETNDFPPKLYVDYNKQNSFHAKVGEPKGKVDRSNALTSTGNHSKTVSGRPGRSYSQSSATSNLAVDNVSHQQVRLESPDNIQHHKTGSSTGELTANAQESIAHGDSMLVATEEPLVQNDEEGQELISASSDTVLTAVGQDAGLCATEGQDLPGSMALDKKAGASPETGSLSGSSVPLGDSTAAVVGSSVGNAGPGEVDPDLGQEAVDVMTHVAEQDISESTSVVEKEPIAEEETVIGSVVDAPDSGDEAV